MLRSVALGVNARSQYMTFKYTYTIVVWDELSAPNIEAFLISESCLFDYVGCHNFFC